MQPRERVLAILNRDPVDRIPVDIWHTQEVQDDLQKHFGVEDPLEIYQAMELDKIAWTFVVHTGHPQDKEGGMRSQWGTPLIVQQAGEAVYHEFGSPALQGYDTIASLDDYPWWPDPDDMSYEATTQQAREASKTFATLGPWVSFFEIYCQMRGLEQALMDIMLDPDYVQAVLDRIESIQAEILKRYLARAGAYMDLVFVSDDMGSQNGLLISKDSWKTYFQDRMTRLCRLIHDHGCKVFYHSDGAMAPLIPDLIETGIDVLNPIQHTCNGMEMENLKREYGQDLIFHGGVDTQKVLPFGSVEEVRNETQHCLDALGGGGGFICASCHAIQAGTPVENILEMVRVVREQSVMAR